MPRCKICRQPYTRTYSMQVVCGDIECRVEYGRMVAEKAKAARVKKERKETTERRKSIVSTSDLRKKAQTSFNAYCRERDKDLPCVSCGRHHSGQYHAGHYMSVGARPELRFEEMNVWKQCQPCNTHLHGNLVMYRLELIRRIGIEKVDWLEGPHEAKHYTREDLVELDARYRRKLSDLRKK